MGFDNECILNIQSLAGEYFCPVCRLLVYPNEALQSQCTHLYCKPCLTYVVGTTRACPYDGYLVTEADSKPLTESNKALAETIGKIAVHCLYHRSGCTWQGPLSDCTSHCSGCAFGNSPVVCNRCGIQIVHSQVQEHAQNCPGVQSQTQQAEGVQEAAAAGVALSIDQNQGATQVGTTTSQAQPSQTTTATTPVQDPNQQANPNPQVQAVQPAVPTPEQLYQQQQYQQYYQQYPGYDPYQQQYQQYYPYQQQAVQQYQQQPAQVPPQHTAQSYVQSQPQPQLQPQAQAQLQAQPQPQPQPQPQSQPHPHVQAPAAAQHQNHQVNPPQQLHPAAHPHSQIQPQSHPPAHGNPPPQPQLYPQAQPQLQSQPMQPPPQSYPMQPHSQQVMQIPQYQQHHSQMQQPQPQIQPQPHSQQHPLPQTTPHSQAQPQPQLQHHPQPQPQLHPSQPNQPPHNVQPPVQHQSAHAVSGHQSYQQPQPQHQMPFIAPQQHSMVMNPQSGPNQQPQHPVQMQPQFPQQTAQMRPPQSHAPIPNQQPPVLLPMPGQGATIPSAQQQQIHPHAHQPGHPVHHRPVMQPNQQPMPQQYVQQQQFPFPGQPTSSVQNQLNKQGAFYQHQQQLPMQSQLRPQAPSLLQQHSSAQPQLTAAFSHGTQPHQSQNQVVRPMFPNHGVQSQPLPQSPGGLGGASQVRPMQLGANQQSMSQNYPIRTNNQNQALSEQQLGPMQPLSQSQIGRDQLSEKNEGGSDEKTTKINANNFIASGSGDDSVEIKTVKYENDTNPTNFEDKKLTGHAGRSAGEVPESIRSLGIDSEVNALEQKDSVIKHVVKEEAIEGTLEPSAGGKSVANVGEDQTDVTNIAPVHVEQHLLKEKEQAENLDEQSRNLHKDGVDNGGIVQPSRGDDKNTKAVPAAVTPGSDSSSQISGNFLSQSQVPRGAGVDESRGFPPPSQVQGRGFVQSSHPIPFIDQGRHPPPPTHYGPSAPSMLHAVPPGPPHHGQGPGLPPTQLRPQGPGYLGQTGQPLNHPDHFQSLGRGPSHSGPPQRSFEQLVAPQEFYNQGRMGPSHAGAPRTSHGESVGGPPAPFDAHGGMVARAPPHGPEGLMGQQRPNPLDGEMIPSQRRGYLDGRQPDLPNMMRLNGPPGLESSYAPGMRDDRFKPLPGEHTNQFPMEQSRRMIERGEFEDDLKQFPRPSHLDADPKFGGYLSSSRPVDNRGPQAFGMDAIPRPLDMPPYGLNYDTGMKLDPSASAAPSRNLPFLRPNDTGERSRPVGFHEDNMGRPEFSHTRPDFLGQVSRYGRHHMDGSPVREYPGLPSRGFGPGVPGVQSGIDIDGRESLRFGDGSKPFNRHSDPIGSFHETRFPMPPHLRRGEHDGPLSLRINEMIGQDVLPGHLRRDDPLGPRNLPSHLRMGEPGFGPFSGHARIGELAGPGNFPPRFGEPGFRSSYTLQDSGFYKGNMESFDNPRKRKPTSMGWCRICKVDCETMEGLDLHSQTREHQDMAMDMVLNIKQQNAKKKKLISNDHSVVEDASKSKSASFESRRNRH